MNKDTKENGRNNLPQGYIPPKIWKWDSESGGEWAQINRPISGATHDKVLPRGKHAHQLYSLGTPNGLKVSILFEELLAAGVTDAEYDAWFIDITKGDQFGSGFVEVNPNSKIPALLDYSRDPVQRVFESGSILLYLAEKYNHFISENVQERTEALNWLFWQMGSAPFLGGGFGHFYHYAPMKIEYAIDRYSMEVKRQLDVLDKHLGHSEYMAGRNYSIADIAILPWYGKFIKGEAYGDAADFLQVNEYKNVQRWADLCLEREGVKRGLIVNLTGEGKIKERHSASDIDDVFN